MLILRLVLLTPRRARRARRAMLQSPRFSTVGARAARRSAHGRPARAVRRLRDRVPSVVLPLESAPDAELAAAAGRRSPVDARPDREQHPGFSQTRADATLATSSRMAGARPVEGHRQGHGGVSVVRARARGLDAARGDGVLEGTCSGAPNDFGICSRVGTRSSTRRSPGTTGSRERRRSRRSRSGRLGSDCSRTEH